MKGLSECPCSKKHPLPQKIPSCAPEIMMKLRIKHFYLSGYQQNPIQCKEPLRFTFNEISGYIENYDETKHLRWCWAQDFDGS